MKDKVVCVWGFYYSILTHKYNIFMIKLICNLSVLTIYILNPVKYYKALNDCDITFWCYYRQIKTLCLHCIAFNDKTMTYKNIKFWMMYTMHLCNSMSFRDVTKRNRNTSSSRMNAHEYNPYTDLRWNITLIDEWQLKLLWYDNLK